MRRYDGSLPGIFVGLYAVIKNRVIKWEMTATKLLPDKFEQEEERIAQGQEKFKRSFAESIKHPGNLIVADADKIRHAMGQS